MRFLLFASCLYMMACGSPYKNLQTTVGDVTCLQKFRPVFSAVLYNTTVNIVGRHLSGLLLIKKMPDSSLRMVFSSEMGIKFFDFEFARSGEFTVHSIIRQMNKKAVINTLRKDFELVLMQDLDSGSANILTDKRLSYFWFSKGKEFHYYITDTACKELVRIDKISRRKVKVQAIMQHYVKGVPDTIGITHRNFNFTIGLKRLER
ncbi:MAG: hypothetical protein WKF89_03920 [Chitinophagaceae bacterium]